MVIVLVFLGWVLVLSLIGAIMFSIRARRLRQRMRSVSHPLADTPSWHAPFLSEMMRASIGHGEFGFSVWERLKLELILLPFALVGLIGGMLIVVRLFK